MRFTVLVWLIVGLLAGMGSGSSAAQGFSAIVPATVVGETRLGPTAGNGTHPFAATLDTRRNYLYVLNQVPQCLSVVDLKQRRVAAVIPLALPFEGWGNSDPFFAMTYDAQADAVLIVQGNYSLPSTVIAVAAATRKIAAVRTFPEQCLSRCAFNPKRGEIYAAYAGREFRAKSRILVLDAHSLATKRILTIERAIQTIATSQTTGHLYTIEPTNPDVRLKGIAGPYSKTEIVVRDPTNGRILAHSPDAFPFPHSLFVDDARRLLYLIHGNETEGRLYASFNPTTVSVLSQLTLKNQRRLRYPFPSSGASSSSGERVLPLGDPILDAPRNRLITDMYSNGTMAVLNLTGKPRPLTYPVEGSLYSAYRLGAVLPQTGQTVLLIDNAVRLLDSRTLHQGASVTLGASVDDLFLDPDSHRLLAYADRDVHEFLMLADGQARRLFKSYLLPRTRLLAVDSRRKIIYYNYNDSWGNGVVLHGIDFQGRPVPIKMKSDGEYAGLILSQTPDRFLRLLSPAYPESAHALQRRSLDIVVGDNAIQTTPVGKQNSLLSPQQIMYAPQADRAYILLGFNLSSYSGKDLSASNTVSLNNLADEADRRQGRLSGVLTVDETGQFGYYGNRTEKQIIKFRLTDGTVADRRSLTFLPTQLIVDSSLNRIYIGDLNGGRVVAISLF